MADLTPPAADTFDADAHDYRRSWVQNGPYRAETSAAGTDQAGTDDLRALTAGHPDDFPCLATLAICPCKCGPAGDVVIRCGNCGTEAHAEEWSITELVTYVQQHCEVGNDERY